MGGNWHGYNLDIMPNLGLHGNEARAFIVKREASMTNSVASSGEDDGDWDYSLKPNERVTEHEKQAWQ